MDNLKNIIESLLFVADSPIPMDRLRSVIHEADKNKILSALSDLKEEYETRKGGFFLDEVAGGFQLRSRPEYREWVTRLVQPSPLRLSKAAIEALAIIAYKQPIIRADIEYIRGVDSGGIIRTLMERKLVRVLGRRDIPGRPLIYATTKRFLEVFDLKDLKNLPTLKEIEEFGDFSEKNESHPPASKKDFWVKNTDGFLSGKEVVPSPVATTRLPHAEKAASPRSGQSNRRKNKPSCLSIRKQSILRIQKKSASRLRKQSNLRTWLRKYIRVTH